MRVVGITGGIGSGKSTVSGYLKGLGYDVIDADGIARDLASNTAVLNEIRDLFGDDVIKPDGSLDRKMMAAIVFSDVQKKELLESIITSRVIEKAASLIDEYRAGKIKAKKDDIVFLDAPTLYETGAEKLVDEVWVITCDVDKRLERAALRDGASREELLARIAAQLTDEEKAEKADQIIDNNGNRDNLFKELNKVLEDIYAL